MKYKNQKEPERFIIVFIIRLPGNLLQVFTSVISQAPAIIMYFKCTGMPFKLCEYTCTTIGDRIICKFFVKLAIKMKRWEEFYLQVSQFWESVHNDTEYDVQANGADENEECHMVNHHHGISDERGLSSVWNHALEKCACFNLRRRRSKFTNITNAIQKKIENDEIRALQSVIY